MKLLLDTHVFLWWISRDPRLSPPALEAISGRANEVMLSVVSSWEISTKYALGRLQLGQEPARLIPRMVRKHQLGVLNLKLSHTLALSSLPPNHGDPFDRMLVCQALDEGLTMVSGDAMVARYLQVLW